MALEAISARAMAFHGLIFRREVVAADARHIPVGQRMIGPLAKFIFDCHVTLAAELRAFVQ
jgi:hypothetical protein